jgi:hypothetical protein
MKPRAIGKKYRPDYSIGAVFYILGIRLIWATVEIYPFRAAAASSG